MHLLDVTLRRDPPPLERRLYFHLYGFLGARSAHSRFGSDSYIDAKRLACRCWSQMDPLRPFWLPRGIKLLSAATAAPANVYLIAPRSQFRFLSSLQLPFICNANHMSCWYFWFLCHSSSFLLSLISVLLPPFCFSLDYDFGDIFPVLQSLPSADWEGGTLVNPSPFLCPHPSCHVLVYANAYRTLGIPKLLLTLSKHSWLSGSGPSRQVVIQISWAFCFIYLSSGIMRPNDVTLHLFWDLY